MKITQNSQPTCWILWVFWRAVNLASRLSNRHKNKLFISFGLFDKFIIYNCPQIFKFNFLLNFITKTFFSLGYHLKFIYNKLSQNGISAYSNRIAK